VNGRIVKLDDDLMSATRMAIMMLRFAGTRTPAIVQRPDPARHALAGELTFF
jgi:hypothetical protein